jgi:VWFA-related protein
VAAALALGAALSPAQQAPPPSTPASQDPQRPTFRTEANFVRVDVYPTVGGQPLLDLRKEDFELLEDGRAQVIDTFEYVRIAGGPRTERADPGSVEAMRQAAAEPRSRIFIIFLDAYHVTGDGAKNIGPALIRFIQRALAPDDLVGVMTPWMSPADVVLARKTQVIEAALGEGSWARRFTSEEDARESLYKACYRVLQQELEQSKTVSDLARVLTVRRREVLALEALRELVVYLRGVREERKAVLVVSEGWMLFRPDDQIMRLREECTCPAGKPRRDLQDCTGCKPWPPGAPWKEPVPGREPIRVGPDGRLSAGAFEGEMGTVTECTTDRMRLASIDNARFARDLAEDANRANATFYTIDPRGLAAFDTPLARDADEIGLPLSVVADRRSLNQRHEAMANLATGTDGLALMNSNDLDKGLKKIADDLSAYYLLGYYSTNAKLDGRFRAISVRVKRPGVDVRARRGYRAPTEAEVAAARAVAAPAAVEKDKPASAVASALDVLSRIRPGARFRVHAIPVRGMGGRVTTVWIAGEVPVALEGWAKGGTAAFEVTGGGASDGVSVTLAPGERAFLTSFPVSGASSSLEIRGRLTSVDPGVTPFAETIRLDLSAGTPQPLLFRRGPLTGNRLQPVADFQLNRSDRARLEFPIGPEVKPGQGRLLDKAGQELKVPVTVSERTDAETGQRWLTADLTLAALGAGEYVVEIGAIAAGGAEQKTLTAIRVVTR